MNHGNEFKVGLAIVVTAVVLFLGVRYLAGSPLFEGGYRLVARFESAEGLVPGSTVRASGVRVGSVAEVALAPGAQGVVVALRIREGVALPRGSVARIGGLAALGDVSVSIVPGPAGAPPLAPGDTLLARSSEDLLGLMQENAGRLVGQLDTLVAGASGTFASAGRLLGDPEGDLLVALAQLRGAATATNQLLLAERARLGRTLAALEAASANMAALSEGAGAFAEEHADTLGLVVGRLNRTLAGAEAGLARLEATSAQLDTLLARLERGEGTLGLLLHDPSLYHNLNEAATNFNQLVTDFQEDPKRYLRELRLIDIF